MNDKEFELQHDLGHARERMAEYIKTIGEQSAEIARLGGCTAHAYTADDIKRAFFDGYQKAMHDLTPNVELTGATRQG